ncbi:DUF5954 family protein [Kitasatospora sp. NBC_01250]|uniref:DUF5954 family protein n=1 Tax=Kitasatospora sp. NBC_01250 TaxID=2903571 RepID=UPI002E2ECC80|nr:DUF5954 family protein [Kitasatospora sp. NBC_01250]
MADLGEDVPGYRTIRMTALEAPVAVLADVEAWQARDAYPDLVSGGGPVFGVARELEAGGWRLHRFFCNDTPQGARESMSVTFRKLAQAAEREGRTADHEECMAAAVRLDWEKIDEMTVLGTRYRVVRAERFIRTGPDGPEPPRPSDPDPAGLGEGSEAPDPGDGLVIDPVTPTGMSEGILKAELLALVRAEGTVPAEVRDDSRVAARTHPGGVLLPATFMSAERTAGRWAPFSGADSTSPQGAREVLAVHLRVMAPIMHRLGPKERAAYTRAADRFEEERASDLKLAGRHWRIVRVERLVRFGPDGPEMSRPSDHDPELPVLEHDRILREAGELPDEDDAPIELDETQEEMLRAFRHEQERRRQRRKR